MSGNVTRVSDDVRKVSNNVIKVYLDVRTALYGVMKVSVICHTVSSRWKNMTGRYQKVLGRCQMV